jgi:hypothetical protein
MRIYVAENVPDILYLPVRLIKSDLAGRWWEAGEPNEQKMQQNGR